MAIIHDLTAYRRTRGLAPPKRLPPKHAIAPRKKKDSGPWCLADLGGKKPRGHPVIKRGRRGKVLLAKSQVWVELHTKHLWVIDHIEHGYHAGTYPCHVWLRPYGTRTRLYLYAHHSLSEQSFRGGMKVWEDFMEFDIRLRRQIRRMINEFDPDSLPPNCA